MIAEQEQIELGIGSGMLRPWVADCPSGGWKSIMAEWIDNSFDADAKTVLIALSGRMLEIIDDGCGCEDVRIMQSPAMSLRHKTTKAGMYGVGGVRSQLYASNGGSSIVRSTTLTKTSVIEINWRKNIEAGGSIKPDLYRELQPDGRTGTTITIPNSRWVSKPSDTEKLFRELSYLFAVRLREGRRLIFDINGEKTPIKAYKPPAFERRIEIDFSIGDHRINGFCGLVKQGVPNPYNGWSVFFGHRMLTRTSEPASGMDTKRIYSELHLPDNWKDANSSKDSFTRDYPELWDRVAEQCKEIIEEAEQQTEDFELSTSTLAAESMVSGAIKMIKKRKGRRPNKGEKEGAVEPSGNGNPHKQFATHQPGDKDIEDDDSDAIAITIPDRVKIVWGAGLEDPYEIETFTRNGRSILIRLNQDIPSLYSIRKDRVPLALTVAAFIAHEYETSETKLRPVLNFDKGTRFKEALMKILARMSIQVTEEA